MQNCDKSVAEPDAESDRQSTLSDRRTVVHTASIVGAATLASRILGAVRDIVIASFFGAGLASDAFFAAFRIPNMLRRMFGEGSLSIVFVPVYTDCLWQQGRAEADRLANSAFRLLAVTLAVLTLAGIFLAPWIVQVIAPGFAKSAGKLGLTVTLTRIMFPYLFCIGLVALCMGILNVLGHFAAPALAPVCLNVAMIGAVVLASLFFEAPQTRILWLAVGVVIGGVMQLGLQVPFLIHNKVFFWQPARLWHPEFKRILLLMGPVMFGAAVYQINSLLITLLGTLLPQGSVSYLYYADRLVQLPLGIFAIAAATAVLPVMARQAAIEQWDAFQATFAHALKLVFFITLPSMAGLIVLREPIVALIFQLGAFDAHATQLTASALLYYAMGLWAFSALRIVLNAFYAFKETRTPVRMALIAIVANVVLGVLLMGPMQHNGLALALSLASMLNLVLLIWALRQKMGPLGWRQIALSVVRSACCATAMGLCVWALARWMLPAESTGKLAMLVGVMVCVAAGVAIYGGLAYVFKLPELRAVLPMICKEPKPQ